MTTAVQQSENFDDVFARDDRDRGADSAAPKPEVPRDDQGRFAPRSEPVPSTEAQPLDPKPAEPRVSGESTPRESPPSEQPRHVPLPELLSEREKRKAEATRREEAEAKAREYEARVQQYEQFLAQLQQQQQQTPPPDPWTDPQGALAYQQQQLQQQFQAHVQRLEAQQMHDRANISESIARQKFGDEAVTAAQQAAIKAGLGPRFMQERDPYASLMKWHQNNSFLQKVGPDPAAYEKTVEERAYQRLLADLQAGKIKLNGQSAAPQRFPGSLADATAAGAPGGDLTDEAIAAEIFSPTRDRRRA